MRLELASKVKTRGVGLSVVEQHEQDSKAIDNAVKAVDEPIADKNLKPTEKTKYRHNIDDSTFNDAGKHNPRLFISGVESLLSAPYSLSGTEGFVESVKNGAKELLRIIESFFTWTFELVFNRIERLNNRYRNLSRRLKADGVKLDTVSHADTIFRLATTPILPRNPEWIKDAVGTVEDFYKRVMLGQDVLKNVSRELPVDFSKEQQINLVEYTTENYAKAVIGKARSGKQGFMTSDTLPGFRLACVDFGEGYGLKNYTTYMSYARMPGKAVPMAFYPNATLTRDILQRVKQTIDLVQEKHKSQTSLRREFEKVVSALSRKVDPKDEKGGKNAYAFYMWLINFQKKSINAPLMYVFSSLNAAMDYCETCIK